VAKLAAGLRRSCHQNHNVTISASRPKRTKALGLNTAARISEVGLNAPQVGQRIIPGHIVAAQRLQTSLRKKQPRPRQTIPWHPRKHLSRNLLNDDLTSCGAYQSRYAITNNASQRSARAVGLIMDARSSEPGLDIPQTRRRLEPALTSAPQPLQAKANIAPRVVDCHGKNASSSQLFRVESRRRRFQGGFWHLSFRTGVRGCLFWCAAVDCSNNVSRSTLSLWEFNRSEVRFR
jgi:hypothetical protein